MPPRELDPLLNDAHLNLRVDKFTAPDILVAMVPPINHRLEDCHSTSALGVAASVRRLSRAAVE